MKILFYDKETSGLPLFSEPSTDPRQPHICQLGALLVDSESRKVIQSLDLIAKPDGWIIPDEVAAIHGITTEHARQVGVDEQILVIALLDLWRACDLRVGHNESFDARIQRIAIKRFLDDDDLADEWKAGESACTANMATPIMKMAATPKMVASGRRYPKKPKLIEAYEHFMGNPMEEAHTAMADARACMEVYFAIKDLGRK